MSSFSAHDPQRKRRKRLMSQPQTNQNKLEDTGMVDCFLFYSMKYTGREQFVNFCRDNILFTGSWKDFVFRRDLLDEFYKYCGGCKLSPVGLGMHLCSSGVKTTRLGKEYGQEYGYTGICFKDNRGRRYFPQKRPRSNPKMKGAWTTVIGAKEMGPRRKSERKIKEKVTTGTRNLRPRLEKANLNPKTSEIIGNKNESTPPTNNLNNELTDGTNGENIMAPRLENANMNGNGDSIREKNVVSTTSSQDLECDGKTRENGSTTKGNNDTKNSEKDDSSDYEVIWIHNDNNSGGDSLNYNPEYLEMDNNYTRNSKMDDVSECEVIWISNDSNSGDTSLISRPEDLNMLEGNSFSMDGKTDHVSDYELTWKHDINSYGDDNLIFDLETEKVKVENVDQSFEITSTTNLNLNHNHYLEMGFESIPQTYENIPYVNPEASRHIPDHSSPSTIIPDHSSTSIIIPDHFNPSIEIPDHFNPSRQISHHFNPSRQVPDPSSRSIAIPDHFNPSIQNPDPSSLSIPIPDHSSCSIPIPDHHSTHSRLIPDHFNPSIPTPDHSSPPLPSCIEEWIYPTPYQVLNTSQASFYNYYVLPQIDTQCYDANEESCYKGGIGRVYGEPPPPPPTQAQDTYNQPRYDAGIITNQYQLPTQAQTNSHYYHHSATSQQLCGFPTQAQAQVTAHYPDLYRYEGGMTSQFPALHTQAQSQLDPSSLPCYNTMDNDGFSGYQDGLRILPTPQDIDLDIFEELNIDKKYLEL